MIDDILRKIKDPDDLPVVKKAYDFLKDNNIPEDVILHSLNVTNILIDLNVDVNTIVSSMLHEIGNYIEDENVIKDAFGDEIKSIVYSVNKLNHLTMLDESEDSARYLRKVMVGLSEDVRVLVIKLADRVDIMRNLDKEDNNYQKKLANETLSVLVPIAHRLGINSLKSELENLCLYYLKPDVYNDIVEKLNDTVDELNNYLLIMKDSISQILIDNEINFEIKGRVKSVYSIYNKLSSGKKWNDIYDILALRIFVEKESECYQVVGLIHSKYRPLANRFKDYIAVPKENMYQSLHTTVVGEGGRYYEVQIRTYEMDEIAEKGIASHWSYKEKSTKKVQAIMEQKLEMYRNIIESNSTDDDVEFSKTIDDNILTDLIYVYTPKGDVVELPKGSTPIDFAYRIHSEVGDTLVGAIVNDQMVPIYTELEAEDVVKIRTSSTGKPSKEWLNHVKTTQAKNKIKSYFSKQIKDEYIEKGKNILDKEIRKRKLAISEILSSENINKLVTGLKFNDEDDLYLSIGALRYTAGFIINYVTDKEKAQDNLVIRTRSKNPERKTDILVDNKTSILTHLAKCCNPVKNDEIIGIITKTDGIAIHKSDCPNISLSKEKIVNVSWNNDVKNFYNAYISLKCVTETDKTSDIMAALLNTDVYVEKVDKLDENNYKIRIRVNVKEEIDMAINALKRIRYVREVERL